MSGGDAELTGMAEVMRLAAELADQMLASHFMELPIPGDQLTAIINAARLFEDNNVPWPPMVEEVVRKIAAQMEAAELEFQTEDAVS